VEIIDNPDSKALAQIQPEINNGKINKLVLLRQAE